MEKKLQADNIVNQSTQPQEVCYVDEDKVQCDGKVSILSTKSGHPLIYLQINSAGKVQCPYCSKLFIKKIMN